MKKRIITIAAALMMATAPAMAQVFIMDEDDYQGNRATGPGLGAMIPMQDNPNDQYIPVGEGVFVLAGLAGAYLLGKRKKEQ